jgi:hypothetical protein
VRRTLPGLAAVLLLAGLVLLAVACGSPRAGVSPIPSSVGTTAPAASTPAGAAPASGFAARSVPVTIKVPAIGVDAPVMELGLSGGALAVPPLADHNLAGWYEYGPSPGQKGPSVIVGHIDSTTGPSVFYDLRDLKAGDRISITLADGKAEAFAVTGLQQTLKAAFPTKDVYGPLPYAGLRLITCGGVFDAATGHYLSNVIVYARLVS